MASELMPLLLRAALFSSLAILLLLTLRGLLRRWLGAALAYQGWLIVPVVVAASLLPASSAPQIVSVQALRPVQALAAQALPAPAPADDKLLLLGWAGGVAVTALWFTLGQRAFLRQARAGSAGPASCGLFRPRIVLPHDFATRYSPAEQALVLAHERAHIARGDLYANLLAALFQCVFWFNPMVHLGVRRFRQDQELACDAAVMQQHPQQRRAYAEALLKSHTGALAAAGIHCHWQHPHPTKERIMSLQHTPPGNFRRLAGRCTLALLALGAFGATLGARAEQAASAPQYDVALDFDRSAQVTIYAVQMVVKEDDKQSTPRVLARAGEPFGVETDGWRLEVEPSRGSQPDTVWLAAKLYKDKQLVGTPKLLARIGEPATVRVGEGEHAFSIAMTVTQQP